MTHNCRGSFFLGQRKNSELNIHHHSSLLVIEDTVRNAHRLSDCIVICAAIIALQDKSIKMTYREKEWVWLVDFFSHLFNLVPFLMLVEDTPPKAIRSPSPDHQAHKLHSFTWIQTTGGDFWIENPQMLSFGCTLWHKVKKKK